MQETVLLIPVIGVLMLAQHAAQVLIVLVSSLVNFCSAANGC